MPIPVAFAMMVGETSLQAALRVSIGYLEKVREARQHHADVCMQYLGAASIAIRGLEQEIQSILVEVDNCDLNDPADRQAVRKRIGMFLFVDHLRPVLWEAVAGIEASKESLRADAQGFWGWRPPSEERMNALANLDRMITLLNSYIQQLDYLQVGSGPPAAMVLNNLHRRIPRPGDPVPDEGTRQQIMNLVNEAWRHPMFQMEQYIAEITELVRALDKAFE